MNAQQLLEYLRSLDDDRLEPLKTEVAESVPSFLHVVSGDGHPLFRIYKIRSEIAKEKGIQIHGFEGLLPSLENITGEVAILVVNTEAKFFLVFLKSEDLALLGMISGPRRQDLQTVDGV
jgi:hypothetical protein